jgi:hypothetical protein
LVLWKRVHEVLPDTTIINLYGTTEVRNPLNIFCWFRWDRVEYHVSNNTFLILAVISPGTASANRYYLGSYLAEIFLVWLLMKGLLKYFCHDHRIENVICVIFMAVNLWLCLKSCTPSDPYYLSQIRMYLDTF